MNSQQTPLEKLTSDKERIRLQCSIQGQKINNDISYIQENAGNLLLSGLSSLLFPNSKQTTAQTGGAGQAAPNAAALASVPFGLTEYLSIAKSMVPVAWELAQPFIVSWGVKKAKKWFVNLFTKKKK